MPRIFNRRSFLHTIIGAAPLVGALSIVGSARAQGAGARHTGVSDNDYIEAARVPWRVTVDQSGYGRQPWEVATGTSDSDPVDAVGFGRGSRGREGSAAPATPQWTGRYDSDSGDQGGYGRGSGATQPQPQPGYTGVTDQDPSDRSGYGRGGATQQGGYTGVTDADPSDRSGYGRGAQAAGRTGLTDSDGGAGGDRAGYGRTGR